MRTLLLALLLAAALHARAHPGNVNKYGNHRCWTDCTAYDLTYGQLHCHPRTEDCASQLRVLVERMDRQLSDLEARVDKAFVRDCN